MTSPNIISPCSCLNDDVLREIFIHCVSDHENYSEGFVLDTCKPSMRDCPQLSVSRVCSSWRHVALLTPQLWNNITIRCLNKSNLRIARKYISNAKNLPISITIGPNIAPQDWRGSQLTDFLSSYQLRSLIVPARIPRFHAILHDLPGWCVENLESLSLFCKHVPKEAAIDLNDIRYPKLTSVVVSGAYRISVLGSSLRIFDGRELSMTVIDSWDLLSQCPLLEEARLSIAQTMPDDGSQRQLPEPLIYHQCLRTLILESKFQRDIPISIFIAALAIPSLEKMHLFNAWPATAFQSLAQRSNYFPNLSDFLLSNPTSHVDAGTLLAWIPSVMEVSIKCDRFNVVFDKRALDGLASGSLAPRLQYLVGSIPYGKKFMDMVESRMKNAQMSNNGIPAPFSRVIHSSRLNLTRYEAAGDMDYEYFSYYRRFGDREFQHLFQTHE